MQSTATLIDSHNLAAALTRWCDAMQAAAPELNALDGQLGDGDLGVTLGKCAENVRAISLPDDASIEARLKAAAQACARASGSSFGTLLAVAFLNAAKQANGATGWSIQDVATRLEEIVQNLSQRGGAKLGDKTMLDSLQAIALALKDADSTQARQAAINAAQQALDEFRQQPNRIGRARLFADRSVGLDDPGMVAVLRMTQAL